MPFEETLYCPECYRSFESGHGYCPDHGARLVMLPGEESLVGTVVAGMYRIDAELGTGGAGTTYRATHNVIERPIALKVFRRFLADDAAAARRFAADADAALQLKGRHTVQVYDSGRTADGRLFLARELVEGPTLAELIAGSGPLEPARALGVALDVARALEYAHARGVVHRGLSPSNIFLVRSDGEEITRVADFAQAGCLTRDDGISLRPEGLAIRPLEYLSPEQAVGASCDVAADLYALGVVLYEALTGRPPFIAATPVELLLAHPQDPPPEFATVRPDLPVPASVEALVRELLSKKPRQRPASASVLAAELEVLLKDPAVAGKAPMPSGPVPPPTAAPESGRDASPTTRTGTEPPLAQDPSGQPDCEISPEPGGIVASPAPPSFPPPAHGLTDPVGSAAVLLPRKSKLPWGIGIGLLVLVLAVVGLLASGVISQRPDGTQETEAAAPPSGPADTAADGIAERAAPDIIDTPEVPPLDGGEAAPIPDVVEESIAPDVVPDVQPEVIPDVQPEVIPDVQPEVIPDVQPEAIPDVQPEAIPDVQPEVIPDVQPEVVDVVEAEVRPAEDKKPPREDRKPPREDRKPPREDRKPPREDKKPPVEDQKPPVEDQKPPVEDRKPPVEDQKPPAEDKKPDPVIAKPAGMDDSDFALAKEQVSWGRKNMKKQLWEMAILNFQQAKRMGLTDGSIGRYIKECQNHMDIVADALERGHAAYLAGRWDEAIRQFQRARDHGEKNTTTFRMIEQAKEAKAQEAADKAK
jgi:serine/threonine protein kinase